MPYKLPLHKQLRRLIVLLIHKLLCLDLYSIYQSQYLNTWGSMEQRGKIPDFIISVCIFGLNGNDANEEKMSWIFKHIGQISYPYGFHHISKYFWLRMYFIISVCIFGLNGNDANGPYVFHHIGMKKKISYPYVFLA